MLFSLSPAGYPAMQMIMKLNLKLYMYSASLLSLSAQSAYKSGRDQGLGSGLHFKALLIANWVSRCEMGSANENLKCGKEGFFFPFLLQLSRSVFPSPSLSFERCQSCFWWHACGQEWQNETKEERSLVSKWRLILARGYMCAVRRREMRYRSAVIPRPCEKDAGSLMIKDPGV